MTTYEQIKDYVETFSAQLKLTAKSGEHVCLGGQIKSIYTLHSNLYDIIIDDEVGEYHLRILEDNYKQIVDHYGEFKEGDIVIIRGKIISLDESIFIFGYSIKPIGMVIEDGFC